MADAGFYTASTCLETEQWAFERMVDPTASEDIYLKLVFGEDVDGFTDTQIKEKIDLSLKSYGAPNDIIQIVPIFPDGDFSFSTNRNASENDYVVITIPSVDIPVQDLAGSHYSIDIYFDATSSSEDSDVFDQYAPGLDSDISHQFGKARCDNTAATADWPAGFGAVSPEYCISPSYNPNDPIEEHFSWYVICGGISYLTISVNGINYSDKRIAHSAHSRWITHSGHAITGATLAGFQVYDVGPGTELIWGLVENIPEIEANWDQAKGVIFNNCHNLTVIAQNETHYEDPWLQDPPSLGFQWLTTLGDDVVILGWGKCIIGGEQYGNGSGKSPPDRASATSESWTAKVMTTFWNSVKPTDNKTNSEIAEAWVNAVYVNRDENPPTGNWINAMGIGKAADNEIKVWAISSTDGPKITWHGNVTSP